MNTPTLIAVLGPTASGKTEWAIRLAEYFDSEIISCDSRQCYRELKIGVARPSEEELSRRPHHFIANRSIHEPFSAGDFEREALTLLNKLFSENPIQVLVGGSGLFAKSLLEGFDPMPEVDIELRSRLNAQFEEEGIESLQQELKDLDPSHAAIVDLNNHQRVIRALEVCLQTGKTYTEFRKGSSTKREFNIIKVAPDWPREELYHRINSRVDQMIEDGLESEARSVYPYASLSSLQTVGYREWFSHFDNEFTRDECILKIKQNSRNYAKRQLTWNRKESGLGLFNPTEFNEMQGWVKAKMD